MVSLVQLVNRLVAHQRIRSRSNEIALPTAAAERGCAPLLLCSSVGFCAAASGRRLRECASVCVRGGERPWGMGACVVENSGIRRNGEKQRRTVARGEAIAECFVKVARRKTSLTGQLASLFDLSELRDPHIFSWRRGVCTSLMEEEFLHGGWSEA